jgi:UDP-glucose 4-epimerase
MMDLAKRNEPLIIFGDGEQTRDFVHVQDVCRALELALGKGGTYNIGTGVETSINNLASIIIEACCSKSIVTGAPEESGQIKHSVADISKARKELRYEPKIGIKHGIEGLL